MNETAFRTEQSSIPERKQLHPQVNEAILGLQHYATVFAPTSVNDI